MMAGSSPARAGSVLARLSNVAEANPDAPALADGGTVVSYGKLLAAASGVAEGIPSDAGRLIGIRMERSWHAVAAMIGKQPRYAGNRQ
jgi:non-ribosomal peptide synthetase component F